MSFQRARSFQTFICACIHIKLLYIIVHIHNMYIIPTYVIHITVYYMLHIYIYILSSYIYIHTRKTI